MNTVPFEVALLQNPFFIILLIFGVMACAIYSVLTDPASGMKGKIENVQTPQIKTSVMDTGLSPLEARDMPEATDLPSVKVGDSFTADRESKLFDWHVFNLRYKGEFISEIAFGEMHGVTCIYASKYTGNASERKFTVLAVGSEKKLAKRAYEMYQSGELTCLFLSRFEKDRIMDNILDFASEEKAKNSYEKEKRIKALADS